MDKKTNVISKKIARLRGWIQAAATLLTNIHIPNLFKGRIYQGNAKTVCVPGLNCYSCPAAAEFLFRLRQCFPADKHR